MSNYDINSNPALVKLMIKNSKKDFQKYIEEHPDSLIPPFLQELRELGYIFEIPDQVKGFLPKHKAIILPIAIRYYQQVKHFNEKDYFMSFFHFKGFEEVIPMLLVDFYSDIPQLTRNFIGDTLYQIRSKKYVGDYLKIIANSEYSHSRQMVVLLVGKLKVENAIPILIKLLDDEDVRGHAIAALGEYKKVELRKHFERFQDNKNSFIRREALKALKKLED